MLKVYALGRTYARSFQNQQHNRPPNAPPVPNHYRRAVRSVFAVLPVCPAAGALAAAMFHRFGDDKPVRRVVNPLLRRREASRRLMIADTPALLPELWVLVSEYDAFVYTDFALSEPAVHSPLF